MSPEQCSQSPDVDSRSDIYSLGVIIFEMLVGHVPFTGESPTAIMLKHLQHPPPSVLNERSDVPEAVGRVVARALEKRPEDRYQAVCEVVEDLTIAAGMALPASRSAEPRVTPYASSEPLVDGPDEETIVRKRITTPMTPLPAPPPTLSEPSITASSFRPWKIVVPSVVGLLVVFAAIYAFTRTSQPQSETTPASTLTADPNSQPVEPATPPSGSGESGIPAGGTTNQNRNANASANTSPSPSATEDLNAIPENLNANQNSNDNTKKSPTPLPSPKQILDEPPPSPAGSKQLPTPRPTLPAPASTPAAGAPGEH
jgi:serine/threonine protein kinase